MSGLFRRFAFGILKGLVGLSLLDLFGGAPTHWIPGFVWWLP